MSKVPNRRRTAAGLTAAVAVAGAAVLTTAPAAQATVVDVNYACVTKIGPKDAVSPVDIKAVKSGSGYTITMSFEKGVSDSPIELPKGVMTPRAELVLGGAASGTVKVKGTPNTAAIPPETPIKIGTLTGTFTPTKNGKVTFTAGDAHRARPRHGRGRVHTEEQPRALAGTRRDRGRGRRRHPMRPTTTATTTATTTDQGPNCPRPARSTPPWPSGPSAEPSC